MDIKDSKTEALKLAHEITVKGSILPTSHLRKRMKERDFDMHDVLCCINKGRILTNLKNIQRRGNGYIQLRELRSKGKN